MTKSYSKEEIKKKIEHYCAYQERCALEVKRKLKQLGADENLINTIIDELVQQNFLNENRFVDAYVRGKINQKSWGKNKIIAALKNFGISDNIIDAALEKFDSQTYHQQMVHLLEKKNKTLRETDTYIRKNKLAQYLINKGFEADLVWEEINNLIKD